MELGDVLARRKMVRSFTDQPIEESDAQRLVDHALRGPSAGFTQGLELLVLRSEQERSAFWSHATPGDRPVRYRGLRAAPLITLFFCDEDRYRQRYRETDKTVAADAAPTELPWDVPFWFVDAGMAALLMLLSAVDAGLGACFLGVPSERSTTLGPALGAPASLIPLGAVLIGHPDQPRGTGSRTTRPRRPQSETVHWGRW